MPISSVSNTELQAMVPEMSAPKLIADHLLLETVSLSTEKCGQLPALYNTYKIKMRIIRGSRSFDLVSLLFKELLC